MKYFEFHQIQKATVFLTGLSTNDLYNYECLKLKHFFQQPAHQAAGEYENHHRRPTRKLAGSEQELDEVGSGQSGGYSCHLSRNWNI